MLAAACAGATCFRLCLINPAAGTRELAHAPSRQYQAVCNLMHSERMLWRRILAKLLPKHTHALFVINGVITRELLKS